MRSFDGRDARLQQTHFRADTPAIAVVTPGESIQVDVPDSSSGQLSASSTTADLATLDLDRVDAAVGPFGVVGAEPGDAISVRIEAIEVGDWGWSGVFRDFGLLRGRFDDALVIWRREGAQMRPVTGFLRPLPIPIAPMVGWLGLQPSAGALGMIPPQPHGGNLDNRLHGVGTELELPVQRPGGGLLVGDVHAAQGDGEVCGTGIEVPARLTLTLDLRKGAAPSGPRARVATPPPLRGPLWVTEGVAEEPRVATRLAVEAMIDRLAATGLEPREAYLFLSLAGHLRLSEVVDEPHWVVSLVFEEELALRAARCRPSA